LKKELEIKNLKFQTNFQAKKVNDDFESKTAEYTTTKIESLDKKQVEVEKCIKVNCNN
jgi:hypothetical protein